MIKFIDRLAAFFMTLFSIVFDLKLPKSYERCVYPDTEDDFLIKCTANASSQKCMRKQQIDKRKHLFKWYFFWFSIVIFRTHPCMHFSHWCSLIRLDIHSFIIAAMVFRCFRKFTFERRITATSYQYARKPVSTIFVSGTAGTWPRIHLLKLIHLNVLLPISCRWSNF